MNQITIIGNLTRIPEMRTTSTGREVCNFNVAVNRRGKDAGCDYFKVAAWGELANVCQKYLDKGKKVCIVGSVFANAYMKDGQPQAQMEITASEVEFLTPRGNMTEVQDSDNPWG